METVSKAKENFREDFSNGWYIEQSSNCRSGSNDIIELFAMKKNNEDNTKSVRYYFAYDVVRILIKECGATIERKKELILWLNDDPRKYKPQSGHKISFHNENEIVNLLT